MSNNIIENEALTTQKNNDNSYIILEDILYYSSPRRGIKSKSNIENKNYTFTPFTSNTEMYNTHFTFHIKESSTDIGSKEELINSQKNSNIISDFSLLKNSKLDNTNTNTKEKEKENYIKTNIKEEIEKEEECEEEKVLKNKNSQNEFNNNSKNINNDYSLNLEEDTEEQNKNHKKFKRKNKRYCSMDLNQRAKIKKKKDTNSKRFVSIDIIDKIKKEKKGIKMNFRGDRTTPNRKNIINERKVLKEIKDKLKNENEIKNKNTKNNKTHKAKLISSYRYPLTSMEDNILILDNNDSNNYKSKTCKKGKRSNNYLNKDDSDNFEDKNFISHPIKNNNNKDELYKSIFNNKSSRFIKKKQFTLVKEIDRDYDEKNKREIQSAKKINKLKNSKKKNKKSKKHNNTEKPKKYDRITDNKNAKEVSDFVDLKENKNHRSKKAIKNKCSSSNIFRKGNMKNKEKNNDNYNHNLFKSKKSTQIILLNNNNRLKLKSSITLIKKAKKKTIESNTGEKYNKKDLLRRHTIFITSDKKQNLLEKKNDNFSFSSEYDNSIIEDNDNGYDQDCSSNSSSVDQNNKKNDKLKNTNMKIGQITEDKLVLNYQDKKETIEVLSDKENIDNYYEYLELCLETLQDMNINEVPKSKAKINFNFPKENQNKKIALFDLDETLVHCIGEINKNNYNKIEFKDCHRIKVILPCKKEVTIGINVRPHWKESLDKIKEKYNIVIFTASHQSYSDAVLNYLDPEDIYFHYRLYRDSCALYKTNDINFYVKDLDIFKDNYNLKDIIIIDNSILSFAYHINNGIPVVPFYDSKQDSELPLLCFYLLLIASYKDLRDANKEHIKLEYFLAQNKADISSIDKENMIKEICEKDKESNNNSLDNAKKNEKNSRIIKFSNVENKDSEKKNNNKERDIYIGNKSEKRIFNMQAIKTLEEKKKYNTVKVDSLKFVDFFDKWKNAYLKLALKK